MTLSDSRIFNVTVRRAASLRQLSFLYYVMVNYAALRQVSVG